MLETVLPQFVKKNIDNREFLCRRVGIRYVRIRCSCRFAEGPYAVYLLTVSPCTISLDNSVPSIKTVFLRRTETVKQLPFISYLHEKNFLRYLLQIR